MHMIAFVLGMMIASAVSGQLISRTGKYRIFPVVGTLFLCAGFGVMLLLTPDNPLPLVVAGMLLLGLGLGQLMQTLTIAAQSAVAVQNMGVATASATFFRQIGGTLGTAIIFSVLFARIPTAIADAFADPDTIKAVSAAAADPAVQADPANAAVLNMLAEAQTSGGAALTTSLNGDTSFLTGADPRLTQPFLEGFSQASHSVFLLSLAIAAIAFVLTLFLKPVPLRTQSPVQEAADAARQAAGDEPAEPARN